MILFHHHHWLKLFNNDWIHFRWENTSETTKTLIPKTPNNLPVKCRDPERQGQFITPWLQLQWLYTHHLYCVVEPYWTGIWLCDDLTPTFKQKAKVSNNWLSGCDFLLQNIFSFLLCPLYTHIHKVSKSQNGCLYGFTVLLCNHGRAVMR